MFLFKKIKSKFKKNIPYNVLEETKRIKEIAETKIRTLLQNKDKIKFHLFKIKVWI